MSEDSLEKQTLFVFVYDKEAGTLEVLRLSAEQVAIAKKIKAVFEEAWSEFPQFDISKPQKLYNGLTAIESIYLNYRLEVEKWERKWRGSTKKSNTPNCYCEDECFGGGGLVK